MIDQRRVSVRPILLCIVLAGLPLAGSRARDMSQNMAQEMAQEMAINAPAGAGSQADRAMMAGMRSMQEAMDHAPVSGDPDHDFVSMMTPHHQGAVDMAQVELRYGRDPELRRLARDIIAAQKREIAQMESWSMTHPLPAP